MLGNSLAKSMKLRPKIKWNCKIGCPPPLLLFEVGGGHIKFFVKGPWPLLPPLICTMLNMGEGWVLAFFFFFFFSFLFFLVYVCWGGGCSGVCNFASPTFKEIQTLVGRAMTFTTLDLLSLLFPFEAI